MKADTELLKTNGLSIGYLHSDSERDWKIENLDLTIERGKLVCLLGPNGAGKSTLMRTLSGLQAPLSGQIYIKGKSITETKPEELARKLSMVLTDRIDAPNMTVGELIALGRIPHTGWLGLLSEADNTKIKAAIGLAGVEMYVNRKIHQLSDGERQKIMLARALAQDTDLILMDEPTSHLDVPNRIEMMHLLHKMARKTGKGILISTHELDLALQISDQIWLIDPQMKLFQGMPEDMVLNGTFEHAFSKPGFSFDKKTGSFNILPKTAKYEIGLSGDETLQYWTRRALEKASIKTNSDEISKRTIHVIETEEKPNWILTWEETEMSFESLEKLVSALIRKFENE